MKLETRTKRKKNRSNIHSSTEKKKETVSSNAGQSRLSADLEVCHENSKKKTATSKNKNKKLLVNETYTFMQVLVSLVPTTFPVVRISFFFFFGGGKFTTTKNKQFLGTCTCIQGSSVLHPMQDTCM